MGSTAEPLETDCASVKAGLDAGNDFLLLDCRERDEHALASIPGSLLIPVSEFEQRAGELEPFREREIVVLCHHGVRSLHVAHWLRQQGFLRVRSLAGGIDRWAAEIDPELARY